MAYSAEEIAQLESRLAAYLEAEASVLRNQSYEMADGRRLERANLGEIRKGITDLRAELGRATGTGGAATPVGRVRRGVPL